MLGIVGEPAAVLLSDSAWLHRRKEAIDILDDEWVRRQTSIDFTIPARLPASYEGLIGQDFGARFLIPVTLLPKLPPTLMRFHLADDTGAKLSVPTLRQCHLAAYATLQWAALNMVASRNLNETGYTLPFALRRDLLAVASGDVGTASEVARRLAAGATPPWPTGQDEVRRAIDLVKVADDELVAWSEALSRGGTYLVGREDANPVPLRNRMLLVTTADPSERTPFVRLVELLARQTLVLADVAGANSARKRIKLSYEERIVKVPVRPRLLPPAPAEDPEPAPTEVVQAGEPEDASAPEPGPADDPEPTPHSDETPSDELTLERAVANAAMHAAHDSGRPERLLQLTHRFGWRPMTLALVMPYARAQTYHVEIEAPEGLEVNDTRVLVRRESDVFRCEQGRDEDVRNGSRVHRYVRPAGDIEEVALHVELRTSRQRFVAGAPLAALAVEGVLLLLALFPSRLIQSTVSVPAFLLLFPTLLVTLAARVDAGTIAAGLLRYARATLLCSGVLAYLAAIPFILTTTGADAEPSPELRAYWIALAVLGFLAVLVLALARVLPRPWPEACPARIPHPARNLERLLEWTVWAPARAQTTGLGLELVVDDLRRPEVERIVAGVPDGPGVGVAVRPLLWRWGPDRRRQRIRLSTSFYGQPLLDSLPSPGSDVLPMRKAGAIALGYSLHQLLERLPAELELVVTWAARPPRQLVEVVSRSHLVATASDGALRAGVVYRVRSLSEDLSEPR